MKRLIQLAEFEADIAAFAEHLPLDYKGSKDAQPIGEPENRITIYGIPKNGTIVAQHVVAHLKEKGHDVELTYNPDHANLIVDDIYDSGRTANTFTEYWNKPVFCMYTKVEDRGCFFVGDQWIVLPWEQDHLLNNDEEAPIVRLIQMLGEDPDRDGLQETPKRFLKAMRELTKGYEQEVDMKVFEKDGFDQLVSLVDIPFFSLCEHHMLPFYGKAHIAYIPNEKIIGLSKLARVVDQFSKRLQNQERITEQVSKTLKEGLGTENVAVILHGEHMCCAARGVGKPNMKMVTSKLDGVFRDTDNPARLELLQLIQHASQ